MGTRVSSAPRVLVLGLDMGDGKLLRAWTRRGLLPQLAALAAEGQWLDLESPAAVLHTSTWPTFATGCLPGSHGVYYPLQPAPGRQGAVPIRADQYARPTLWSIAAGAGKRCLVFDVPETFPEPGFTGKAVFEWGVWARYGERAAQPPALLDALEARFGAYPLGLEATRLGLKLPDRERLERRLLESVDHKARAIGWLLDSEAFDLAVAVFGETHPAGHYLTPDGSGQPGDADDASLAPLLRVYAAVDRAIGELRARASDAVLLVVSGDGVRRNHCGWHLLPEVMERLGYTRRPEAGSGSASRPGSLLGRLKSSVPAPARRWIADHLPSRLRESIGASIEAARVDFDRSVAFTLPTDLEGCVRVNLEGREPRGIVEPGPGYAALCEEIAAKLSELTNTATGEPAVARVWIRDAVLGGEAREHLPDLIVTWNDAAPITSVTGPSIGTVSMPSPDPRAGTHSTEGFLLAHGPGIAPAGPSAGRLVDVAPTVLGLLGLDEPADMDGKPIERLAGVAAARPDAPQPRLTGVESR